MTTKWIAAWNNHKHSQNKRAPCSGLFLEIKCEYRLPKTPISLDRKKIKKKKVKTASKNGINTVRFLSCRSKSKAATTANQRERKYHDEPMSTQSKNNQTSLSARKREWPCQNFACDWLRRWRVFSKPITRWSQANKCNRGLLLTLSSWIS